MALICPSCGEFAGPLTQALHAEATLVGTSCVCGGRFEEIDDEILKALLPFAPDPVVRPPGDRWGWLVKSIGEGNMQKIAALPPVERIKIVDTLRREAVKVGVQDAHYSGPDFSAIEGEGFLRGSS